MRARRAAFTAAVLTAAVLTVAGLPACTNQSHVSRSATVHVTGRALAVDGRPLADRPVKLGSGVPSGDAAIGVLTFGLACTSGLCAGTVKSTTTDAAGAYDLTLKGSETQSTFGEAKSELLTVSAAPTGQQISGPTASARFRIQTSTVTLPELRLVDPDAELSGPGPQVAVHWAATSPPADTLTFLDRSGRPVWQAALPAGAASTSLDGRVLEDTQGRATLSGGRLDHIQGSDVTLRWTGPGIGYASAAGAPPSRGRTCTYTHAGAPVAQTGGPCALTDGDLAATASRPAACAAGSVGSAAPPCPVADAVTIDLGTDLPVSLVVVRGCATGCAVAVGPDPSSLTAFGTAASGDSALAAPGGPRHGRYVRVALGGDELREISVWGPAPATALAPLSTHDENALRGPFTRHAGHPHRGAAIAVAAVLLALVLAGLGFALGRRRASR